VCGGIVVAARSAQTGFQEQGGANTENECERLSPDYVARIVKARVAEHLVKTGVPEKGSLKPKLSDTPLTSAAEDIPRREAAPPRRQPAGAGLVSVLARC
jgi:hypothetical protein